jgi:hypothetical protein
MKPVLPHDAGSELPAMMRGPRLRQNQVVAQGGGSPDPVVQANLTSAHHQKHLQLPQSAAAIEITEAQ